MENIVLTIDDKKITCAPGTSILDAASQNKIKIPHLCLLGHADYAWWKMKKPGA